MPPSQTAGVLLRRAGEKPPHAPRAFDRPPPEAKERRRCKVGGSDLRQVLAPEPLWSAGRASSASSNQVQGAILERLERVRPGGWALAMHYLTRWDPRFKTPMRMEDLFRYPVDHLRHHRHELRAAQ
jgi:hypothetical protein